MCLTSSAAIVLVCFFKGWIVFVEKDEGDVEVICHNDVCSTNDSNEPLIMID